MKKRFFGVLLALAVSLMAGTAMASETVKFTLTATLDGVSALSEEFSLDPSKIGFIRSSDIGSEIILGDDEDPMPVEYLVGEYGPLSKDLLTATGKVTVSSSSAKVKFAVADPNDGEVLDANLDGATMGFYENDDIEPKATLVKAASGINGFDSATTVYVPVSVKTVEDPTAEKKEYVERDEGKSVVYVAVKVNFQAVVGGEAVDLPKTYSGSAATARIAANLTKDQKEALSNKGYDSSPAGINLFLNKSIANELHYSVDDAFFTGGSSQAQATASQAKKVKDAGVDGVQAVMPEMGFTNSNTSAYVFAPNELSDDTKNAIAAHDASLYFLNLTKTHANASVAEDKPEEAQDVIFLIYDADAAEFREPDEDDEYDLLFIAFSCEPGTFQPFIATGEAPVDPSSKPEDPSSKPEDPSSKPEDPSSKPEDPSSKPEDPSSSPVNPSGSHKSSGSSGCDMGMVSGLAILLAALLPLRKVRK